VAVGVRERNRAEVPSPPDPTALQRRHIGAATVIRRWQSGHDADSSRLAGDQ